MKRGWGFLTTKGADGERKSVNEKAPRRADARLGACVYRFVMVKITQGTASACPPLPAAKRRGEGLRRFARPVTFGLCFFAILSIRRACFHAYRSLLHGCNRETSTVTFLLVV